MATITPIKPHTRIDNEIIDDYLPQIGTYGFTIYSVIKRHLNQKSGQCNPSYATISRKIGIDRGTVIRYVKKLKALGLIAPDLRFKEDGSQSSHQYNFSPAAPRDDSKQGSSTEPPPVVAEDNPGSGSAPPKQSSPNKKERTITEVDFFAENPQTPHSTPATSHKRPQTPLRQRTCSHPPSEIVFLADNVTICHHCYGLLDENLKLQEGESPIESGDTPPVEIVAA